MTAAKKWTEAEIATLRHMWSSNQPVRMWEDQLPGRNDRAIYCMAHRLGLPVRTQEQLARPVSLGWRIVQNLLMDGKPRTAAEIATETGLSRWSVMVQLRRNSETAVHVVDYRPGRQKEQIWQIGPGKTAPRPAPKSHSKCVQEWRRRALKSKPEIFDAINARRRIRNAEKRGKLIRRDIAASWI